MAKPHGCRAKAVPSEQVIRIEASPSWVVVKVPLDTQIFHGFEAKARHKRRKVACFRQESDSGQIERSVEKFLTNGENPPPKRWIEKIFLRNLPARSFARLRRTVCGRF